MNVSLSLNNFDWEAVFFFYFTNYNINQCMHDNLLKKGEISSPFKARVRINL